MESKIEKEKKGSRKHPRKEEMKYISKVDQRRE